eukprot:gene8395-7697_t
MGGLSGAYLPYHVQHFSTLRVQAGPAVNCPAGVQLSWTGQGRARAVTFSPDSSTVAVASTGGDYVRAPPPAPTATPAPTPGGH